MIDSENKNHKKCRNATLPLFPGPGSKNPGPGGIPGLLYSGTVEAGVGGVDFPDFWGPGGFFGNL
jgi:hypothetical protein